VQHLVCRNIRSYTLSKILVKAVEYAWCLELLDKTDRSLAFAVFGAAQYDSFPVTVLPVGSDELLLCFDGVFMFLCYCFSEE